MFSLVELAPYFPVRNATILQEGFEFMKARTSTVITLVIWAALVLCTDPVVATVGSLGIERAELGRVVFPNSGATAAQAPFLRGVAALHSFWYREARDAFRKALQIDPGFEMAYWGEAMSYNHPLWDGQDLDAGRAVLSRMKAASGEDSTISPREKDYLETIRVLYGPGDKRFRDRAYSEAMGRLHKAYPDDPEAACFYALSLLGLIPPGERDPRIQMQAAAILEEVFSKHPHHPGAAHYLIHAYDDPVHAPLGLRAALVYAKIAPASPHALHMPSHIFLQLGMWSEAAQSNESAWAASEAWVKAEGLPVSQKDHHSLEWLHYVYLQQGRFREADRLLEKMKEDSMKGGEAFLIRTRYRMEARQIMETGHWSLVALPDVVESVIEARLTGPNTVFVNGMSAAKLEKTALAHQNAALLKDMEKAASSSANPLWAKKIQIMERELWAVIHLTEGDTERGLSAVKDAVALEDGLDLSYGLPNPMKPAHELCGEILLTLGRPQEAAAQFDASLLRTARRTHSLLGLARAQARLGNRDRAAEHYYDLAEILRMADPDLPCLDEVERSINRER
jgi:tetratricopeptide (TPR) repeat protein